MLSLFVKRDDFGRLDDIVVKQEMGDASSVANATTATEFKPIMVDLVVFFLLSDCDGITSTPERFTLKIIETNQGDLFIKR